jgi:hypothetical protein
MIADLVGQFQYFGEHVPKIVGPVYLYHSEMEQTLSGHGAVRSIFSGRVVVFLLRIYYSMNIQVQKRRQVLSMWDIPDRSDFGD